MTVAIQGLILDMDGVLWHGETPLPGLAAFFDTLRQLNIRFVLATNNATKTAVQYTAKFAKFGIAIPHEAILTSAEATARYLRERYEPGTAVYVIGEEGLHEAIRAQGFFIITPGQVAGGAKAPLVVAGFNRHVTYQDFAMGSLLVRDGATYIGTNPDLTFPSEYGPLPGAGSLLSVISTATGVKPIIIGKPGAVIFETAVKRLAPINPQAIAMVGDRLSTDIAGAQAVGLQTILVLSGISQRADIETENIHPTYVFADINELAQFLRNQNQNNP